MSSVSLSKDLEHLNLPAMLFNYLFWHGGMTFSEKFSTRDQVVSAKLFRFYDHHIVMGHPPWICVAQG